MKKSSVRHKQISINIYNIYKTWTRLAGSDIFRCW